MYNIHVRHKCKAIIILWQWNLTLVIIVKCILYLPCSWCTFLDGGLSSQTLRPLSTHHHKRNWTFICTENTIFFDTPSQSIDITHTHTHNLTVSKLTSVNWGPTIAIFINIFNFKSNNKLPTSAPYPLSIPKVQILNINSNVTSNVSSI